MCVYVCVYIYLHTHVYIHTRVHTYTRTGDISTLALPEVVDDLLAKAKDAA